MRDRTIIATCSAILVSLAFGLGARAVTADSSPDSLAADGIGVLAVPERIVDSRVDGPINPVLIDQRPGWATAVFVNVTVTNTTSAGFAVVYDCGEIPETSNVNWSEAGAIESNLVITPMRIPTDRTLDFGEICVYTSAPAEIVVDMVAWARVSEHWVLP